VAQTIVVCRLRTVLELGRPRKTMACPTAKLICCTVICGRKGTGALPYRNRVFQVVSFDYGTPRICQGPVLTVALLEF
jgi:hypothetical protein